MEAMVFFCTIVTSRIIRSGRAVRPSSVRKCAEDVYVYGDDLVVPADEAPSVIEDLELFGLKVNSAKSFWTGKFRESCGGDYYDGRDVTPVYCRRPLPCHRTDVKGLVSAVAFANQLYWAGMWKTSKMVREIVERLLGDLPSIAVGDQWLGWESVSNARSFRGWDDDYQRPKNRWWSVVPVSNDDVLDDDEALLKCFRTIGQENLSPEHLLKSVRYGNLALKRRWY
jgi:hypothetical protein